jgi:hypothetical protein
MLRMLAVITTAAALGGCANFTTMPDWELAALPSAYLCGQYDRKPHPRIKAELIQRGDIPADQWADIDAKLIHVGMTEMQLICAFGQPGPLWGEVNTYADAYGVTTQYIYSQDSNGIGGTYVYVRNGVITNIDQIKRQPWN